MSNRRYASQFSYSFERQPVKLMGAFTVDALLTKAALSVTPLTLTAVAFGTSGNSITIELVDPGEDSALVIEVTGNAIVVTLASSLGSLETTYTELKNALNSDPDASDLILVTGAGAGVVSPLSETPLAGGQASSISSNAPRNTISMVQTGIGAFDISITDDYQALIAASLQLQTETEIALVPTLTSADVTYGGTKTVTFVLYDLDGVPTDATEGDVIYVDLTLRNASVA